MSVDIERCRDDGYKSVYLSLNRITKIKSIVKIIKAASVNNANKYLCYMPLRHNHLVVLKEVKYEQNQIYIKMPFLHQFSIDSYNSLNLVSNILLPICEGLRYIHSYEIIHGSLKPSNLFVDDSGTMLVSDIWHRFLYPQHIYKLSMNNLYYSSPEIMESKSITLSSDIWSFGEIICYCFNHCNDIIHSKNIKDLYKEIYNLKNNLNINLTPLFFQPTLRKMFSVNPTERPSLEEVYNQLKKLIFENLSSEDLFMLLDECEDYVNDTDSYDNLAHYCLSNNDCFLQLIDRINNCNNYKESFRKILMNVGLKDREKKIYILKHLKYNIYTQKYFNMLKLISNDNEIEIDYDNNNSTPLFYTNCCKNIVYSLIIKNSKPNIVIKSYYQLSHLLYQFTNLKQLTISNVKLNNQMEKIFYSIVSRNSQLVDLKCSDMCLIDVKLNYLKYSLLLFTNLKKLSVSSDKISDDVVDLILPYVTSLHNLKELNISHNNIKALTNLPPQVDNPTSSSLSLLSSSSAGATTQSLTMSTPSNVQSLLCNNEIRKYPFQPELFHPIFSLNHLERLNLSYNQIDDKFLPKLFKIIPTYHLKSIDISANSFCDVGFVLFCSLLSKMPQLEDLSFDSNKLSDASMNSFATHLSDLPNLKSLKIGSFLFFRSPIGDGSIDKFSYYLSCIPKLEVLTITDTDMTDDGFFSISEQFSSITNLQKLTVTFRKSTPLVFKEICSTLYNFSNLKLLDLSWNELGDTFISILSQYFSIISGLELLALNENCIKDISLKAISKNIHYLSSLQELYLSRNSIEDEGVLDLSKHFSSIQKLKTLDLSINMISNKGIMYMAEYSSYLINLECLSFAFNRKLTSSSTNDFVKIITQLDKLERLYGAIDLPEDILIRLK